MVVSSHFVISLLGIFVVATCPHQACAGNRSRFGDPRYWEENYNTSGVNSSYEWFLKSEVFVELIRPYVELDDRVVQLGCGNSRVAEALAKTGHQNVLSIDVSPSVIEASRVKYPVENFPALQFAVSDVFAMNEYANGSFDVALDKGTWDAIPKPRSKDMLREVRRVLRPGGVYLVLTFSRPSNALDFLLDWRVGWKVEDILTTPNPLHDGKSESLKEFYLYICRNDDRGQDWTPEDVSADVQSAIATALEYQSVDWKIFGHQEL